MFGHLSTGASNDLEVATRIARHMITRYGMSDSVGPVSLEREQNQFLGEGMPNAGPSISEETQHAVDREVRSLISKCEDEALRILGDYRDRLDSIRGILMEKEVIEREEFEELMA